MMQLDFVVVFDLFAFDIKGRNIQSVLDEIGFVLAPDALELVDACPCFYAKRTIVRKHIIVILVFHKGYHFFIINGLSSLFVFDFFYFF